MGWGGRLGWRMAGGGAVMSLAALVLFTASAGAGAAQGPAARSYAELFGARSSRHELIVKLADAAAAANLEAAARSLGGRVEPLFSASPASLAAVRARAERRAGRTLPDLSAYRRIVFSGANAQRVLPLVARLPGMVLAYAAPLATPPPSASYVSQQGYRDPAPAGVDAGYLAKVPGAQGDDVGIFDLEYSWDVNHEDLSKARATGAVIPSGPSPVDPFGPAHGTAVLGELVADSNSFGVTGITSASAIHMVNVDDATFGWNVANAVQVAHQHAKPGDVILIEQQIAGPDGAFVPLEWDPATYDAIVSAVADGVIVVETAGNGGANLDNASLYGSPFPLGKPDSGAIIVGAGAGCPGQTARSRLAFSDYGARVDLQGWGNCVATTGWDGNLTPGASLDHSYTNDFSGTSSAGPIVASSAAALTSALIKTTGSVPSARAVRRDLVQYGTPQAFTAGTQGQSIGPLPNMAATLEAVLAPSVFFEPFANLAAWSPVKGVSLESIRTVSPGFAAQAVSKGAGAGYAVHSQTLSGTGVYVRSKVYVVSQGSTSATLLKVRNSANGGIAYLYRTAAGYLAEHNAAKNTNKVSTTKLSAGGWHDLQLHLVTGSSSLIEVWLDGRKISGLSSTAALGQAAPTKLQIGDDSTKHIFKVDFDDIGISRHYIAP